MKKSNQHYNESFKKALEMLNPEQREAVTQIEGPVLVIAGPGTGKTHILTARIGRILQETDTLPQNILCLTFTDAGVHAMRNRLLEFIGPEAHRVHIYTFHSFCNTVIQENLEFFGRHDLEPLSDLERIEITRKIIDRLDVNHPLKSHRNDAYFYEKQLQNLFSQMKSEDWTSAYVLRMIDDYLEDLPNRQEYIYQRNTKENKKGDLKQHKINDEKRKMERLRAAASLYPTYVKTMERARRYDYDDMILWVLRAFENNPALLRNYQERYLYFLVDEYQDTNGSQNHIVQKLIEYWDNPNIFIVGDDDQSIFEFQGARLKNLEDFHNDYKKDLQLVLLKDNYRSTQHILDASKTLIDHNENRITNRIGGIEKALQAKHQEIVKSKVIPRIFSYKNRTQEDIDIVTQIETLQKNGVPLSEVAIIYAKHRQARNIISLLEKKHIPYNTKRQVNILDLPLIVKLRTLLEYLNAEQFSPYSGEHLLFQMMHYDFLGIEVAELGKLSFYMAKHSWQDKLRWREVIGDQQLLTKAGIRDSTAMLRFSDLLEKLIGDYPDLTLIHLLERVINRSGLLSFVIQHPEKNWYVQVLNTFFEFVKKETDRNPRLTLFRLLEIFKNMDANRLPIGIQKSIVATDGVNLVTAHSSKGLEFRYVFMIDCVKDHWEPKNSGNAFRFPLPDTLTLSGEEDAVEARRRLFYVAMTRAKEHLQISYSQKKLDGKQLTQCIYVDEIVEGTALTVKEKELSEALIIEAHALQLLETEQPILPQDDRARVAELLEGFTMSISSLNRFLRCPLSFYYENVLKLPAAQSEAASYGIAMHHAMRKVFEKRAIAKPPGLPSKEEFLLFFENEMNRQRNYFSNKEFDRRLEIGKKHLSRFYDLNHKNWPEKVETEYDIRNVEWNGVPLKGVIDRIDLQKNHSAHLVDYKTGSTDSRKVARPTEKNPIGGLYWRQLVFYKILYELHQQSYQAHTAEIAYLEADPKEIYIRKKLEYNVQEVELVKGFITDSYQKIINQDFYRGCGEKRCPWCNFAKQNIVTESLIDVDAEDLDD